MTILLPSAAVIPRLLREAERRRNLAFSLTYRDTFLLEQHSAKGHGKDILLSPVACSL